MLEIEHPSTPGLRSFALVVACVLVFGAMVGAATSPAGTPAGATIVVVSPAAATTASPAPPRVRPLAAAPDLPAPATAPSVAAAPEPPAPAAAPKAPAEQPKARTPAAPKRPPIKHLWLVVLPDGDFERTLGPASQMPFLSGELAPKGTVLSSYVGIGHPAAVNGVALLSGLVPGEDPAAAQTLPGQLTGAGLTWHAYVDTAGPDPCHDPAGGRNPFAALPGITETPECGPGVTGFDRLVPDLADPAATPAFSYLAPAPAEPADADEWVRATLSAILQSQAYADDGLVVVTWDHAPDDSLGGGGRVGALLLSQFVGEHQVIGAPYDHFVLLRSIEELFGLEPLGYAAKSKLKPFGAKVYSRFRPRSQDVHG